MTYKLNLNGNYLVTETDSNRELGVIINYGDKIGWEFSPFVHTRFSYLILRRLYNKVYQLRKRDGQE